MNDANFILDLAERGFSRTEVAATLEITVRQLSTITSALGIRPAWRRNGTFHGQVGAATGDTAARAAARERANAAKLEREGVWAFGEFAFPVHHWRKWGVTSYSLFKTRYYMKKWPIERALTEPAKRWKGEKK